MNPVAPVMIIRKSATAASSRHEAPYHTPLPRPPPRRVVSSSVEWVNVGLFAQLPLKVAFADAQDLRRLAAVPFASEENALDVGTFQFPKGRQIVGVSGTW